MVKAPNLKAAGGRIVHAPDDVVLAFRRSLLDDLGWFQGLNFDYGPYVEKILSARSASFVQRIPAETDDSLKQIIPYVILEADGQILSYQRGRGSGEQRLVSKLSIGFGGHIGPEDDSLLHDQSNLIDIYRSAVEREVNEEIYVQKPYAEQVVAVINDDETDVGRVHFGIVHLWRLDNPTVTKRESLITRLQFLSPHALRTKPSGSLETWTRFCLDGLDTILSPGTRGRS